MTSAGVFSRKPTANWRDWVRYLAIPYEWQEAVIRAAITLEAERVRRYRRDRRCGHHLDPGSGGQRAQLGLPLLLAPGCLFRRQCAEPAGREAVAMERYMEYIVNVTAGADGRAAAARVLHQRSIRGWTSVRSPRWHRLSRHRPGARRQPGLSAGAERRIRVGGAGLGAPVFRPARETRRRRSLVPAAGAAGRARRRRSSTSRTRACGNCAVRRMCIPSPA